MNASSSSPLPLFRRSVVEALRRADDAPPLPGLPLLLRQVFWFVLLAVAALAALLWVGEFTRTLTVPGFVTADAEPVNVYPPQAWTFHRVLVHEGDRVREGQPLFELHRPGQSGDVIEAIQRELDALSEREQAEARLTINALAALQEERRSLDRRIGRLRAAVDDGERKLALSMRQEARGSAAASRNHLAAADLDRLRASVLADRQFLHGIRDELAAASTARVAAETRARDIRLRFDLRCSELAGMQLALRTRLRDAELAARVHVRAPLGGTVQGLSVVAGQTAIPHQPALSIAPAGARYQARLLLPGRAVGFAAPGDIVALRIEAYPYRKYGVARGRFLHVADAFRLPGEAAAPFAVGDAAYPALVEITSPLRDVHGVEQPLRPGLRVDAVIPGERRRLVEWLLLPAFEVVRRSRGDV